MRGFVVVAPTRTPASPDAPVRPSLDRALRFDLVEDPGERAEQAFDREAFERERRAFLSGISDPGLFPKPSKIDWRKPEELRAARRARLRRR